MISTDSDMTITPLQNSRQFVCDSMFLHLALYSVKEKDKKPSLILEPLLYKLIDLINWCDRSRRINHNYEIASFFNQAFIISEISGSK